MDFFIILLGANISKCIEIIIFWCGFIGFKNIISIFTECVIN